MKPIANIIRQSIFIIPVLGFFCIAATTLNPVFEPITDSDVQGSWTWKSPDLDELICGMDVGDVNGDGLAEIVLATPDTLTIYQVRGHELNRLDRVSGPGSVIIVGIDVGDINANGVPEIYVTGLTPQRNALASFVLEWNGSEYKYLLTHAPTYFRIQRNTGGKPILWGQTQAFETLPSARPVIQLQWQASELKPMTTMLPAGKTNLLGMALGDISNNGKNQWVAFNEYDKLCVVGIDGTTIWTSREPYGGNQGYMLLMSPTGDLDPKTYYLPVRVRLADLEKDGRMEAIVPSNTDSAGRLLASQRFFDRARIIALRWNGQSLVPVWQTPEIQGRVQDLSIADYDNDGQPELIAAIIVKEGNIISKPKSALIAYELK